MAKKHAKGKQAGDDAASAKREEPLQAVLLADDFFDSFAPLTFDHPKVLLPLNNVTLLDYALDFLAGAGVQELFVVCTSQAVQAHMKQQTVIRHVTIIMDSYITNAGDALRELDKRGCVKSDPFILMFGDCITNVDLSQVIQKHKGRHKKDSSAIMTLLMKPVGATVVKQDRLFHSAIRPNTDDLMVGLDPANDNRILVYDNHLSSKSVSVPCSFFAAHSQIELRSDLLDCGLDLCSPDVLARFSDEFDYRDIRREFVANSVAEEEEGLQQKMFCHLLSNTEYAARVRDTATYHAISNDLLRRWCYPVVPDHHYVPRNTKDASSTPTRYTLQRHYLYYGQTKKHSKSSRIGRSSTVKGPGMIGVNCWIGEECLIQGTVLGNNCEIASHVTIQQSHVWDNVRIEQGATIVQSILAHDSVIMAGAVVPRGCCIGAGCVVGANVVLPEFTRLTLAKESQQDDFDDSDEWSDESVDGDEEESSHKDELVSDRSIVGPDGKGRVWQRPPEDEDEELEGFLSASELPKTQSIGFDPCELFKKRQLLQQEEDDDLSIEDVEAMAGSDIEDNYADGAIDFVNPIPTPEGRQKGVDVVEELKTICLEFESGPIENLAIELNSFKFSQNASYSDCTTAATLAILEKLEITKETKDGKLVADFKTILENWGPLLQKMSFGLDAEQAIVEALETGATGGGEVGEKLSSGMSFRFLLQTLFDEEIVSEDAILAWAAKRKEQTDDTPRARLFQSKPVQDFLEWLEEESEDEDDSEE